MTNHKKLVHLGADFVCFNCWEVFDNPETDGPDEPESNWLAPRVCPSCGSENWSDLDYNGAVALIQSEVLCLRWRGDLCYPEQLISNQATRILEMLDELKELI